MKTIKDMIEVNVEQAKFYDAIQAAECLKGHGGYAENRRANLLTRIWARLRYSQQAAAKKAGIEKQVMAAHGRWLVPKAGGSFLEVGSFSGSPFTFRLATIAGTYLGVDLSPAAIEALNQRLTSRGLAHKASGQAVDFLSMESDRKFDVIYAYGVLHHFEVPGALFAKLASMLNPDGMLVFTEPSAHNPGFALVRACFRPFQADADWEWPFTRGTVEALETHFTVRDGFGWGRWSLPLSVFVGLPVLGTFLTSLYVRLTRREVGRGWYGRVWHNSTVTAICRVRA